MLPLLLVAATVAYDGEITHDVSIGGAIPAEVTADVVDGVPFNTFSALHCETCFDGGGKHTFAMDACGPWEPDCYDCHSGMGSQECHQDPRSGTCEFWHNGCDEIGGFAAILEGALGAGDLHVVRNLVVDGRATLNVHRGAIQISDCAGHVVGHYTLTDRWIQALAD